MLLVASVCFLLIHTLCCYCCRSGDARIGDICLAGVHADSASSTSSMAMRVTPGCTPPEQSESGRLGPWTDVYALGGL
jgi:hypothetical protein